MSEKARQEWFIAERTRALAMVYLTRRDDLALAPAGRESGLDLVVSLKGERGPRPFGVMLRGALGTTSEERLDEALRPAMQAVGGRGEFPYPVCLLYFTMADDRGYYTWVAEPAVVDGVAQLVLHSEPHGRKFDRTALDEIVGQVGHWYEAFFARVAVKAS